jgi:forkhead transcription factor HCM1
MGSTRESMSMQVYQDPSSGSRAQYASSVSMVHTPTLLPLGDASSRNNIFFDHSHFKMPNTARSPTKTQIGHSSSPIAPGYDVHYNMVPMPQPKKQPMATDCLVKKTVIKTYEAVIAPAMPQQAMFTTFPSDPPHKAAEKENIHPAGFSDNLAEFPDPWTAQKTSLKRAIFDGQTEERPVKKLRHEPSSQSKKSPVEIELPRPEDLPFITDDDENKKPPYSYAIIIGMAILRAPNRRLTLSQIYKWISDSFAYYRVRGTSWHNSIRHNLSLNKAFVKQERAAGDHGKGSYWMIESGHESQFLKERAARKIVGRVSSHQPMIPFSLESDILSELPRSSEPIMALTAPTHVMSAPTKTQEELSSDATIPASDTVEDETEGGMNHSRAMEPAQIHSSPPQIRSSPPIVRTNGRQRTPPSVLFLPSSVRHSAKKKKYHSMNDSGYISSLESSVPRPSRSRPASSHGDAPQSQTKTKRRGRAEEEIARIRQMSHDSPSKGRLSQSGYGMPSSSPLRGLGGMLPPHTPASRLQVPARPPPSISPNTNLQAHRDRVRALVGSPLREMKCLDDEIPWSPSNFYIHDDGSLGDASGEPGIYDIYGTRLIATPQASSPLKFCQSNKKPLLTRSITTGRFATELNGGSNVFNKSPSKGANLVPSNHEDDLFASLDIFTHTMDQENEPLQDGEKEEGFAGLDLLKGFRKIGGGVNASEKTDKSRPVLGRSSTNRV